MAFFHNNCFLCSICLFLLSSGTGALSCHAGAPDHVLPQLVLADKPEWKIRLLYGHGASVSYEIGKLPGNWKKGVYGDPYFTELNDLSDEALYKKVEHAAAQLSNPFMRIKAFMLWHGRGTERNTAQAVKLWLLASKAGDETSMDLLSRLPKTPDERLYIRRYNTLKRNRNKLECARDLYVPRIYFVPQKSITMLKLGKDESVAAFLTRAVEQWKQGKRVRILLAPED